MQKVLNAIQEVRFTESTLRHASIRDKKGPSLGEIQVKPRRQRSPYAIKFEVRSHEENERQQRCARSKAWNLAKNIYKLKEKDKATLHFPASGTGTPGCVQQKSWRKESLWWIPQLVCIWSVRKTLNSAELETMRSSRSPTTVMTANGEMETREEATVHVNELDLFVTVMLLEETPTVLSLVKLCEDHGYTYHWTSGQKPLLTKKGKKIVFNITNYVPFVVPGLSTSSSISSSPASSTSSSQYTVVSTENPARERSETLSEESRGNPSRGSEETKNIKKEDDEELRAQLLQDVLECVQDFKENLVDKSTTSILSQLFS